MTKSLRLHPADLVGFGRLANDATAGITDVAEALHAQIALTSSALAPPSTQRLTAGITALVYNNIREVTRLINGGLVASAPPAPGEEIRLSLRREAVLAAINGVLGDYLVRTNNPLAISMSLRRRGRTLAIERHALQAAIPQPAGKLLLLAHGLCLNDLQWKRKGHNHGAALARELGYTPVYLRYNSGLHVSENGRMLAGLMETLVEQWPVPVRELAIIGHSMGGLVARSALHYGTAAGHHWPRHPGKLMFLGTPHHGAPLERLGNWVDATLEISPYTAPFARLGKIRSAGITDMRHGSLLEDDWKGRDRFASAGDVRGPLPLPAGVQGYVIAATKRQANGNPSLDLLGDGLVPVNSALGHHQNPEMSLGLGDSHEWIGHGMNHLDLLSHPAVYDHIKGWFGSNWAHRGPDS
jgi:pimeloyl-ACP methyl ester carboxylesterase